MSSLPMRRESPRRRLGSETVVDRAFVAVCCTIELAMFIGTGSFLCLSLAMLWLSWTVRPLRRGLA